MQHLTRPDIRIPLELLRIRQLLVSDAAPWDIVRQCLELANELFHSETLAESPLLELGQLDHVGFVAPVNDVSKVTRLAAEVGFDQGAHAFPSTILAAELGLPVQIVKARGRLSCVEVFMPTDLLVGRVDPHVAFRLKVPLEMALRSLQDAGYQPLGSPRTNPADRVTALYLRRVGTQVRLELCWPTAD